MERKKGSGGATALSAQMEYTEAVAEGEVLLGMVECESCKSSAGISASCKPQNVMSTRIRKRT